MEEFLQVAGDVENSIMSINVGGLITLLGTECHLSDVIRATVPLFPSRIGSLVFRLHGVDMELAYMQ